MANTITNMTYTALAQVFLEAFVAEITPLTAFATNFNNLSQAKGDKIKVPFVSAADAALDFAGTYVMQDADVEGKDVTLDKHKYVSLSFTDTDMKNNPQLTLEMFMQQKAHSLAKAMLQDVFSVVTNANYGAVGLTSTAANFDFDDLIDLKNVCDVANFPTSMRNLIIDNSYINALLKDNTISGTMGINNADVIASGRFGQAAGMQLYGSNLIPANGENLTGFVAIPSALLIASRVINPAPEAANYVDFQTFNDPASGITLAMRTWYDPNTASTKRVMEVSYGYAVGNTSGIKRVVSV